MVHLEKRYGRKKLFVETTMFFKNSKNFEMSVDI